MLQRSGRNEATTRPSGPSVLASTARRSSVLANAGGRAPSSVEQHVEEQGPEGVVGGEHVHAPLPATPLEAATLSAGLQLGVGAVGQAGGNVEDHPVVAAGVVTDEAGQGAAAPGGDGGEAVRLQGPACGGKRRAVDKDDDLLVSTLRPLLRQTEQAPAHPGLLEIAEHRREDGVQREGDPGSRDG